ncbi:MAG: replication initiation factor domain-containing protein [Turicibacter sp.]|nr:replication initiation factor domain-containing protein [Turicibacter sp.]
MNVYRVMVDNAERLNVTRIDLAIDDKREVTKNNRVTIRTVARKLGWFRNDGFKECVTNLKKVRYIRDVGSEGETVEIGSRASQLFFRFYDKRGEMIDKGKALSGELPNNWIRYEAECKGDKANLVADMLLKTDGNEAGKIAMGILKGALDFRNEGNSKAETVKHWEPWRPWQSLLNDIEPLKLSIGKQESTVENTIQWADKQWPRAVAKLSLTVGHDKLIELLEKGMSQLTDKDKRDIEVYNGKEQAKKQREQEIKTFDSGNMEPIDCGEALARYQKGKRISRERQQEAHDMERERQLREGMQLKADEIKRIESLKQQIEGEIRHYEQKIQTNEENQKGREQEMRELGTVILENEAEIKRLEGAIGKNKEERWRADREYMQALEKAPEAIVKRSMGLTRHTESNLENE